MDLPALSIDVGRGFLAGLVVCIPPGPMGALCVSRSVRHGFMGGFPTAAGAAVGDALYAALAAFGVATFRGSLTSAPRLIAVLAAPVLLWMGVRLIAQARRSAAAAREGASPLAADGPMPHPVPSAFAGFVLSLGTPGTLPAFVALFAASADVSPANGFAGPTAATLGALLGALLWWIFVTLVSCRYRTSMTRWLPAIDAIGGAFLVVAAIAAASFAISGFLFST